MKIVALALAATALAATPARASDTSAAVVRYAVFNGTASPRTGGTASTCAEILTGSVTPFPCEASFHITVARGVCNAKVQQKVGTFDYFSPTTGFSMTDVPLTATVGNGVGFLVSSGIDGTNVFHVSIGITALCDEQSAGPFTGHVAYI
jgi:hypothetical protein